MHTCLHTLHSYIRIAYSPVNLRHIRIFTGSPSRPVVLVKGEHTLQKFQGPWAYDATIPWILVESMKKFTQFKLFRSLIDGNTFCTHYHVYALIETVYLNNQTWVVYLGCKEMCLETIKQFSTLALFPKLLLPSIHLQHFYVCVYLWISHPLHGSCWLIWKGDSGHAQMN